MSLIDWFLEMAIKLGEIKSGAWPLKLFTGVIYEFLLQASVFPWQAGSLRKNVRLGRKGLPRINTLAYYENP
jgi:hypothetical protein